MTNPDRKSIGARFIGWMTILGRYDRAMLIALAVAGGGIWGFVELADEVAENETLSFDETILRSLRNPNDLEDPLGPLWFEEMVRDFTALGSTGVLIFVTVVVFSYLLLIRKNHAAMLLLAAVVGGLILSTLLKELIDRPRPSVVPHGMSTHTKSFPSGHSMLAAATYMTLGALMAQIEPRRRMKAFFLLVPAALTFLVGLSRLYLGVHYPTDVLAGWTCGATWAVICWIVVEQMQRSGQVESEDASGEMETE